MKLWTGRPRHQAGRPRRVAPTSAWQGQPYVVAPADGVAPAPHGKRMRLVLLGPPGAGKGTQGQRLAVHYGVPHVATGDIIRDHIARRTEFGRKVEAAIAAGNFAPDEDILYWVSQRLSETDAQRGYVLDGFPRDLAQAQSLGRTGAERRKATGRGDRVGDLGGGADRAPVRAAGSARWTARVIILSTGRPAFRAAAITMGQCWCAVPMTSRTPCAAAWRFTTP